MYEENGLHIFCNKSLNKKKSREDLFYFMIWIWIGQVGSGFETKENLNYGINKKTKL
jgi:hypothetical protein